MARFAALRDGGLSARRRRGVAVRTLEQQGVGSLLRLLAVGVAVAGLKDLGAHPVRCCYEIGLVKPSLVRQLLGGAGSSAGAGEQRVARGWGHV